MRKTPMLPSDEASGHRRKKGKYRHRTDVPIGKPVKGPTRRRGRAGIVCCAHYWAEVFSTDC